ncbi:hypothetical protein LIA77_01675 [Sarocladium implicatum]|nr:hypothetical protein LIA77_01675 [Sarocladium implicatum]
MFRRRWGALPKDPVFPPTLEGLGYFVNDDDEVRSIEDPESYYRYRVNHNERVNLRLRFHLYLALEDIVHQRLQNDEGLEKLALPLGTPTNRPHIPIFASPALDSQPLIVLVIGDTQASLGLISGRVVSGQGGINKGSAVSLIRSVNTYLPTAGIVIANPGQLVWWPGDGERAITVRDSEATPHESAVSYGKRYDERVNTVPGHENEMEHLKRAFELLETRAMKGVKVFVFGIERGAEAVQALLDDEKAWKRWGGMLESMVLMGTLREAGLLTNEALKGFLKKRCRCYAISDEPIDTPLAGPTGNSARRIPALDMPVYSSGEPAYSDSIAVTAQVSALKYLVEVAASDDFENPEIVVVNEEKSEDDDEKYERARKAWEELGEEQKPAVEWVSETVLREQRMWNRWEETGVAELDVVQEEGKAEKSDHQQTTPGQTA